MDKKRMTEYIKVNLPLTEQDYLAGNGEGVWVLVDPKTKQAHDTDATGGGYVGILDNDSCYYPSLNTGQLIPFELRGAFRPVANFYSFLSKLPRLTPEGKALLLERIAMYQAESNRPADPSDPHYEGPLCCNCQYCGDKYSFPEPNDFRFDYPTPEEILAYLTDKLGSQYQAEIEKVILFSKKVSLNYDCLRAIAFELSLGEPFEKAILDLNIVNTNAEDYNITLCFKNGDTMTAKKERLDLFDRDGETSVYLWDEKSRCGVNAMFTPSDCIYDSSCGALTLAGDYITLNFEGTPAERTAAEEKLVPERMTLTRAASRNIHYLTA